MLALALLTVGMATQPRGSGGETRRSRFRAVSPLRIFAAHSADGVAAAIRHIITADDIVLECGCQLGATTALLAARCRSVVGVDLDRSLDSRGRSSASRVHATAAAAGLPSSVRLECLDVFDALALQSACPEPVSLIVLDTSSVFGADMMLVSLALCRQLSRLYAPSLRAVIIKSRAVSRLQWSLTTGAALLSRAADPAAASRAGPAWRVVGTVGVAEYREAGMRLLESSSEHPVRILEVGCHMGTTTALLHARAAALGGGSATGVDVSRSIVERARALHPGIHFETADAWDVTRMQEVGRDATLLMLDVGGISSAHGELDTLALLAQLRSALPSLRAVVVKSHCLRTLATQMQPWRRAGRGTEQAVPSGDTPHCDDRIHTPRGAAACNATRAEDTPRARAPTEGAAGHDQALEPGVQQDTTDHAYTLGLAPGVAMKPTLSTDSGLRTGGEEAAAKPLTSTPALGEERGVRPAARDAADAAAGLTQEGGGSLEEGWGGAAADAAAGLTQEGGGSLEEGWGGAAADAAAGLTQEGGGSLEEGWGGAAADAAAGLTQEGGGSLEEGWGGAAADAAAGLTQEGGGSLEEGWGGAAADATAGLTQEGGGSLEEGWGGAAANAAAGLTQEGGGSLEEDWGGAAADAAAGLTQEGGGSLEEGWGGAAADAAAGLTQDGGGSLEDGWGKAAVETAAGVIEAGVVYRGERVGVVASGEQQTALAEEPTTAQARFRRVLSQRHGGLCVVLENVEKENAALISRTLEGLGVGSLRLVYSDAHLSSEYSGGALQFGRRGPLAQAAALSKMSKSASDWMDIRTEASVAECVAGLRAQGYECIAATAPPCDVAPSVDLYAAVPPPVSMPCIPGPLPVSLAAGASSGETGGAAAAPEASCSSEDWACRRLVVVFGAEGGGLSASALTACDLRVSVPQQGMTQSFNVAACAALVMGEVVRRRSILRSGVGGPDEGGGGYARLWLTLAEQRALEDELLPGGRPPRLHNKAGVKRVRRKDRRVRGSESGE